MRYFLVLAYCLTLTALAQPSVDTFTDYAKFEAMKISPKGTYLAYTQREGTREYLVVAKTADMSIVSRSHLGEQTDVANFEWVNDERLLVSPARSFFGADIKQPTGEILGLNADGSESEILFGIMVQSGSQGSLARNKRETVNAAGRVIDYLPHDDNNVIVQSIGFGFEGELNQTWTMDVYTGKLKKLVRSPIKNGTFATDGNHQVRYVSGMNDKAMREMYFYTDEKNWKLLSTDKVPADWIQPIAAYGDGKMLISNRGEKSTSGISVWDPVDNTKQSIFHHDQVDMAGFFTDNDFRIWAVRFVDHFPDYFYPDPQHPLVALHKNLRAVFPHLDVQIVDETEDLSKVIVYLSGPQNPGDFLVLDTKSLKYLARMVRYPNIVNDDLSRVDPIEFKARDGLSIRGYITMPKGKPEKQLPLVVLPHGGPYGPYDAWGYNSETQMLASRGYAVLQVNFRGSGGRGQNFEDAGYGEWGAKMQDDITDAVRWAIQDGVADPQRICIMGGSYGGYAALYGAATEPDLFKCAVGMAGVYDLNLLFKEGDIADARRGQSYLQKVLGENIDQLAQRSPVNHAEKITAKVMLVHGKQDVRAPIEHAERMKAALEKVGKEVVWVEEGREAHGMRSETNRSEVYEQVLEFLQENIGG